MARAATASTPSWEFLASTAVHVLGFAVVVVARCGHDASEPLFKPDEVMVVEMAGPPKNVTRLPQKAERAPDPVAGTKGAVEPTPQKQSDMAFETPDAKTKGEQTNNTERERLLADMRRRAMLDNLDAPVGQVDRAASSPDGAGVGGEASAGVHDPEMAKWVMAARQRVGANWHPLLAICQKEPNLTVVVKVEVEPDGRRSGDPFVGTSSGNTSFDQAALRAVEMTASLPPVPAKYPNGITASIKFVAKEAL